MGSERIEGEERRYCAYIRYREDVVKQAANPTWVGWLLILSGALVMASALVRDWSTWPDSRSVLPAGVALVSVCQIIVGVVTVRRDRRRRDGAAC
ncbi:hypothetical protein TPB0596_03750 [Tsukamurella pulmonis]|uniref:hypothetical protein n=1 Tax=Tsukamurella pulmonis TaxID=47312 RepID=UPI001EE01140|nr:hypothetical protein [Tsukamurella pulmonis]BDD80612.1 hypothetical protein TPB0596_03750 [Tsukamurella pulmonis]